MKQENTMRVLIVEPMKPPYAKEIPHTLDAMQEIVGGIIQAVYPSCVDEISVVCNDEGKLMGLPPNRLLRDDSGRAYDYIAGTFFVCGLGREDFTSLSSDLENKYTEKFSREMLIEFPDSKSKHKRPHQQER